MEYFEELVRFLAQSGTGDLKTAHFKDEYAGLKVKVSFGKGNPARVTWISFLAGGQQISNGIYPFYLYYKKQNILILAYGVSETISPEISWKITYPEKIGAYFKQHNIGKPARYGDSFVFKVYEDPQNLSRIEVEKDLRDILKIYRQTLNQTSGRDDVTAPEFIYTDFQDKIAACNLHISAQITLRFIASLLSKPFVILTGLSGSGKTKLAQAFSGWICGGRDQICVVAVGADWTNREPLLGYPNALEPGKYVRPESGVLDLILRAMNNPDKPYFLILDEMNLSHVERYFADFLSAMESGEEILLHPELSGTEDNIPSRISLPKNLFIIGTVNIDETTYMFSPKVLDRANVIEFRITLPEMEGFLEFEAAPDLENLHAGGAEMGAHFIHISRDKNFKLKHKEQITAVLLSFFKELQPAGAEFGYRSASEILRFASMVNRIEPSWTAHEIIDAALMQKLLPKVYGSRRKLEPVLRAIARHCVKDSEKIDDYFNSKKELSELGPIYFPVTLEKLGRMYRGLIDNGFTSYAEA
jgi:5-methylcytosine-specific restriction protein B